MWLLRLASALAADPESVVPAEVPVAEGTIVVWGDRDPVVVRSELDEQLKKMGFPLGIRLGDKVVYESLRAGYGRVEVWDDGRVHVTVPVMAMQSPVMPQYRLSPRAGPDGAPGISDGRDALALGPNGRPQVTAGPTFAVNGRRVAIKRQADLTEALAPKVREWNDAIADVALRERLMVVTEGLHTDWSAGRDARTRRSQIAARWLATADSPSGAKVRALIRSFVATVVAPSGEGFTAAEIEALNAQRLFPDDWAGVSPPGQPEWISPPPVSTSWVWLQRPGSPLVLAGIEMLPAEMVQPREFGRAE